MLSCKAVVRLAHKKFKNLDGKACSCAEAVRGYGGRT